MSETMDEPLPTFAYHPDPIATGVVTPSSIVCKCCGGARGYIYVGPVYSVEALDGQLCPWCIADGSAAERFDASFVDEAALAEAGVDPEAAEAVCQRTPGYNGWQQETWLAHCDDACAFHGEATRAELESATPDTRAEWQSFHGLTDDDWRTMTAGYRPGGDIGFYRFICRHCGQALFVTDLA